MKSEQREESEAVKAARARVAALKAQSNKRSDEQTVLDDLDRQEIEERKRIDREGEEALRAFTLSKEAEVWRAMSPDEQARATVVAAYDWATHKRTAEYDADGKIKMETGRGVMVVTGLDRDAAAKVMKPANKVGEHGVGLYDSRPEAVLNGLLKATRYPDGSAVQMICEESPAFASAVHSQAVQASGAFASVTSGK